MSSSCKPNPLRFGSDIHRLLLAAEAGQKTDILAYYSGHLGPRSLKQILPQSDTKQDIWKLPPSQKENLSLLTQRQKRTQTCLKKDVKESFCEFTVVTALTEPEVSGSRQVQANDHSSHADRSEDLSLPKIALSSSDPLLLQHRAFFNKRYNCASNSKQKKLVFPICPDQEGLINDNQLKTKQMFSRKFTAKQNVAEIHERKLQKELKKLSVQNWPCRDRLAVFSDVFDDVCESSPVFGRILREIKTDYDLYVHHVMASHTPVHNMSLNASDDLGNSKIRNMELEDAKNEVSMLEREARRLLEQKKRIQKELQNVPAITGPEDMKNTSVSGVPDSGAANNNYIQSKRLEVLKMWRDVQQLEEEIKEKLVSTVTATATERCIKVLQAEIMRLIASNDHLKTVNKDLENQINLMLNREKSSKTLRRLLWDEIQCDLQTESLITKSNIIRS